MNPNTVAEMAAADEHSSDLVTARIYAGRGALRMDARQPGWFRTVDPERLDVVDQELCVLGQTCGSFSRGIVVMGLFDEAVGDYTNPAELPEDYGFDAAIDTSYVALRTAWTEEIMARRAAA